jgi:hypothetical protein
MDIDPTVNDRPAEEEEEVNCFKGLLVHSPLRCAAIATGDPRVEAWRFGRMSEYMLVCKNNITKHKETIKVLGLDKTFEELMGLLPKKGQGKRKWTGKKGGGRSKWQHEEAYMSEGEGDDEENEEEDEDNKDDNNLPARHEPCAQCAKPAAKGPAPKEWILKARKALEVNDFGTSWSELVGVWYLREESKGFVIPVSRLCLAIVLELILSLPD